MIWPYNSISEYIVQFTTFLPNETQESHAEKHSSLNRNMQYDNATTTSFLLKREVCHEISQAWPQERAQCLLEVVGSSRRQAYWVKTSAGMCFSNTLSWRYHPWDWEEMLRWEAEGRPQSSWEYGCTVKHYTPRTYTKVGNKTVLLAKWDLFE